MLFSPTHTQTHPAPSQKLLAIIDNEDTSVLPPVIGFSWQALENPSLLPTVLAEPAWGLVWWVQGAGCLAQVRLVRQTAVTLRIILVLPGPDLYTAAQVMDVSGILDCTSATDELVTCLAEVAQGNYYLSRHLAVGSAPSPEPKVADQLTRLSLAQLRVLAKVADGLEAAEIADCLCLATDTVKHHKAAIMARLGLASQPFLYFFAERHRKTIQAETNRRLPSKS